MTSRGRAGLGLAALAVVTGLSGCTGDAAEGDRPRGPKPAPVELAALQIDEPLRVGLIVSAASEPGQGEELLPAAAGAQVAARRLTLGGATVDLQVVDDKGTEDGAERAVASLLDAGVSGIVVATAGDHVWPALTQAAEAGTAVLAPYLRDTSAVTEGIWLTGPDDTAVDAALEVALERAGLSAPAVVSGDGVSVGLDGAAELDVDASDPAAPLRRIRDGVREGTVDSVVVAASARTQAGLVAALQGRLPDLPVFLTPEALSADFAAELVDAGGTTADELVTVGVDAADATTLESGPRGEAVASYFSALRLLAGDPEAQDLFDAAPFGDSAGGADTASHDAVVALAVAAAEAGSTEPGAVRDALRGEVEAAAGVAGPALDFSTGSALPEGAVVPLHATTQDPGVRPVASAEGLLRWFAVPTTEG